MKIEHHGDYAKRRREAYPSLADQLDTIYHHGIDAWRDQINAVKRQFPKPDTGAKREVGDGSN